MSKWTREDLEMAEKMFGSFSKALKARERAAALFELKTCDKCGKKLPYRFFGKNVATKDRLKPWCRMCTSEYARDYREKRKEREEAEEIALIKRASPEWSWPDWVKNG